MLPDQTQAPTQADWLDYREWCEAVDRRLWDERIEADNLPVREYTDRDEADYLAGRLLTADEIDALRWAWIERTVGGLPDWSDPELQEGIGSRAFPPSSAA